MSGVADYRHRITIQQQVTVTDDEGFTTTTWQDVATVWAAVEPMNARWRVFYEAAAVNAERDTLIRIRYRPGVTQDMRVVYGQRVFSIRLVVDPEERHREIQLMCREVVDGGN
ncbi:phage head closure protein [Alicyclobacillus shizuokensis]|uniref:phage head closure protein n=1 Tax=Alicyclobacillus shizuokensis TaxID=392014 RepID=UPI00082C4737|nr:phage head closure protein [Alicyclobacillus shizuokensis]